MPQILSKQSIVSWGKIASYSMNSTKSVGELLKKVKAIVSWFKRCTPESDELR